MKLLIRQPIVAVLGHVNAGKTTLLDRIRGTAISKRGWWADTAYRCLKSSQYDHREDLWRSA